MPIGVAARSVAMTVWLKRAPEHLREAWLRGAPGYVSDQSGRVEHEPGLSGREGAAENPRRSFPRRMSLPDGRMLPDEPPDVVGGGRSGQGGDRPAVERFVNWASKTVGRRIATVGASLALIGTLTGLGPEGHLYKPWREVAARPAAVYQQVGDAVDGIGAAERRRTAAAHLDTILDSVLITPGVPPGVPFEDRIGHVGDPRIKQKMESVDSVLGGRVEWPDVHVIENLGQSVQGDRLQGEGLLGLYSPGPGGDVDRAGPAGGVGASGLDPGRSPGEVYGILLDKDFVHREFEFKSLLQNPPES